MSVTLKPAPSIRIVSWNPIYAPYFKSLNEAWINEYFTMEEPDRKMLEEPDDYIISRGGAIVIALQKDRPVGVCALVPWHGKKEEFDFELAKMAVAPEVRGEGVGESLGREILRIAREKGAGRIYLETNTVLAPALRLYKRLGFREITGCETPYSRCNTQMEYVF